MATDFCIALVGFDDTEYASLQRALAAEGLTAGRWIDGAQPGEDGAGQEPVLVILALPQSTDNRPSVHVSQLPPLRAPLMVIGSTSQENAIQVALDAGAADYLVRPLRARELGMRIRVLLRRTLPAFSTGEPDARFGDYRFDTNRFQVYCEDQPVALTRKEFELALLLFTHLGRPLSRAYIQEQLWGADVEFPSRTLDTHISRVRNKLGLRPDKGYRLSPVYSYGYLLEQLEGPGREGRGTPGPAQ